jgi:hypothetical protein
VKKTLFLLLLCSLASAARADYFSEKPPFSLMFHTGAEEPTGYIQGSGPAPELGAWMGVDMDDHLDGFFGLDYYTMPDVFILLPPTNNNPQTFVAPTDDISATVNIRWYPFNEKWDYARHHYNISPYIFTGLGIDFVVDNGQPVGAIPVPPSSPAILNTSYDILFATHIGGGIDFPVGDGRRWSIYTEALDHLIFWNGLTQVFDGRVGVRFMLDTAHADPFH